VIRYYTGVGSRETPHQIRVQMAQIASHLAMRDFVLRSGAAPGADEAFETGLMRHQKREIYLPWKEFNGHKSKLHPPSVEAMYIASRHHPAWGKCGDAARMLHARNVHQVLGKDLNTPSAFLVCWTPGGTGAGGTGQAIRIAQTHQIPVFDLAVWRRDAVFDHVRELLAAED